MDQNVKIGLTVDSNGTTDRETKKAHALKAAYDAAAKSAGSIGGTAGSRSAAQSAQPMAAAQVREYGQLRGSAGATGASARDFANQAQGLSGLVRLYAVYAANIFAVGAAFRALSEAMNTTNMIRGLDQLGAATGRNLGSLSKRVAELSDGALSLRESMQVVAQTSAAGMSSKNIERLTLVAKNASVALGRSMPDAVDRLSRGISKLEPELLDELGIMTKIEPAVQAYARELGKAASQLTDYERRQAFANAVLKEGEEKFGAIAGIATNPFDKLLAALKNLMQSGMEFLNRFLGPVVDLLATSPTALAGAVAGVGVILAKQALPALGEFKAGLAAKTEAAQLTAQQKVNDALKARQLLNDRLLKDDIAYGDLQIKRLDNIEKIAKANALNAGKENLVNKLLKKDIQDITDQDLKRLEVQAKRFDTMKKSKEADFYRETALALKASRDTEEGIIYKQKLAADQVEKDINNRRTIIGLNKFLADQAEKDVFKKQTVSAAAYNASLIGISGAWKLAQDQINSSDIALGRVEKSALKARTGLAILGGAIGTLGTALNSMLGWIGLIITALGLLDSWLSKSGKESANFSASINSLEDSVDNAKRTLEALSKQSSFGSATIAGIFAMSNALTDLIDSTEKAIISSNKLKSSMGWWDSIKNSIASVFGGGLENNLAKALTSSISESLNIARKSGLDQEFEATLKDILSITSLDTESVLKALINLSDTGKEKLVSALKAIDNQVARSNSVLQSYKAATENTTKAYQEFIQSTADTNPLFKLGTNLQTLGQTMQDILNKGPRELTAAILDLAKSPEKGMLFGNKFITQLLDIRQEFSASSEAAVVYTERLQELNKAIEERQTILSKIPKKAEDRSKFEQTNFEKAKAELKQLESDKKIIAPLAAEAVATQERNIEKARGIFVEGMNVAFKKGSELIAQGLGQASEKAALTIAKAAIGGLTGEAKARAETNIALRDISLKEQGIKTSIELILAQERLTTAINLSNAIATESRLNAPDSKATTAEKESASAIRQGLQVFNELINSKDILNLKNIPKLFDDVATTQLNSLVFALNQRLAPQRAALTTVGGEKTAAEITGQLATSAGRAEDVEKRKSLEASINDLLKTRAETLASFVGLSNKELLNTQYILELTQLSNKQDQESRNLQKEREAAQINLVAALNSQDKQLREQNTQTAIQNIQQIALRTTLTQQKQQYETSNLLIQNIIKSVQIEIEQQNKLLEIEKARLELQNTINQSQLEIASAQLDLIQATTTASQEYLINQRYLLDIRKTDLDYTAQATKLQQDYQNKSYEASLKILAIEESSGLDRDTKLIQIKAITDEQDRQFQLLSIGLQGLKAQSDARKTILDIQKESNLTQERYNKLLQDTSFISKSLSTAFGDLGKSIGSLVDSMANFAVNSDKGTKALEKLNKARDVGPLDPKEQAKLETDIAKQKAKNSAQELDDLANIAGATKSFFKEKTGAYKVMNRVEQALRIASMADKVREMALDQTSTLSSIANSMARAGAKGIEAITGAYKAPWPWGFVAGAAMSAIIGGLLGKAFGGGKSGPTQPTAQQRQETQGSAMGYNAQGEMSQFRRGVLGDPTAKSQLIDKSIELLAQNSVDNLTVNNKMLQALYKIEAGIRGVSAGIYNIPGLASGSAFGTQTGSSGFNLLGLLGSQKTREIIDSGLKFSGTLAQLAQNSLNLVSSFETVATTTKRSFLFFSRQSTSTDTQIQSLGQNAQTRRLAGYLDKTFSGAIDFLEETAQAAGFGKAAAEAIINSFDLPEELRTFSTRGLKPEEMGQAFQAWLGGVMDFYGEKIFAGAFDEFAQGGEEITQTVARIINANEAINQSFRNLGLEDLESGIKRITGLTGVDLQVAVGRVGQELIDLAGGLDKFAERANFIAENFLTEAQKKAVQQETALREINKLGLNIQDFGSFSRQDYMTILNQLKQASIEGRQGAADLYNSWANLAPVLDSIIPKIEEVGKTFQDTLNKELALNALGPLQRELIGITDKSREYYNELVRNNQATQQNVDTLKNWETTMMSAARAVKLQAQQSQYSDLFNVTKLDTLTQKFRKLGFSLPNNTRQLQRLIDSIDTTTDRGIDLRGSLLDLGSEFKSFMDNATSAVRSAYDSRAQELKGAQTQFKDFAKSIKDFRTSLLTGNLSTLLPQQQYAVIKSEFQQTAQLAMQGNVEAIQKLQGLSSQFLETSRGMYASSEQYTQDFNSVLEALDSTTTITELQVQIAENTLTEIKNAVSGIIDLTDETTTGNVILTGLGSKLTDALQVIQQIPQTSTALLDAQAFLQNQQNLVAGPIVSAVGASIEANAAQQDANRQTIIASMQNVINQLKPALEQTATNTARAPAPGTSDYQRMIDTTQSAQVYDPATNTYVPVPPDYYNVTYDGFAKGANYIPKDMIASIHKGERIVPAADNAELMAKLSEPSELKQEIAKLNENIKELQKTVAQGAVINADATNRNTEEITGTLRQVNETAQYINRVQSRTTIV